MTPDEYHAVAQAEMAAFDALPPAARETLRQAVYPLPCEDLQDALLKHRMVYKGSGEKWLVRQIRQWDRALVRVNFT